MDIRTELSKGTPLLFDGATGTCFAALPGRARERCEWANLLHPEEILALHRAYLEAGSRAIKTNTFSLGEDLTGADAPQAEESLAAGCRLALEAAEPYGAAVFADMGPAPGSYLRQAELFLQQGLTHFLVETLPSDEGIPELAAFIKERCPEAFLLVSFAVQPDGVTQEGHPGQELYTRTAALDTVDAVGFNCVSGPHHMLEYVRGLKKSDKPLAVMPNAGYPTVLGRRTVYQGKSDYFAAKMAEMVRAGAAIVGGCCGTTPEHIAQLARALREPLPAITVQSEPPQAAPTGETDSPLWAKLNAGKRVIAVELDPPAQGSADNFLADAKVLRDSGADAVTIADCPVGRPRADSSLLACKLHRELGIEPLPHLTCRDRNLNATRALLLGLSMEGVRNVLLVTGDPIPSADRDAVKSVFNFNSRKLARYAQSLNESILPAPLHLFGALNVNARNFEVQLGLAKEKEECGVTAFLTQPVLSEQGLENLKLAHAELKGKILGGIFPVISHRNACFLNNEVAGIHVCDEIVNLYEGKERDECEELALRISLEIIKAVTPYTDGLYLMTPFRRVELMSKIMAGIE